MKSSNDETTTYTIRGRNPPGCNGISFPKESDFVQKFLSIKSHFVDFVVGPLLSHPPPKSLVFLVQSWHHTMAIFLFEIDQLFMLLVPFLIFAGNASSNAISCPCEPDFVQKFLSIRSQFVVFIFAPLPMNPLSKTIVLRVKAWHDAMAILSFKIDQFIMLLVPYSLQFLPHSETSIPNEPDFVQKFLSIRSQFVLCMKCPLRTNPLSKSLVLLVPFWHDTMAILSFQLDQLFILLMPFLV
jgi:hypothetical protein